MAPVLRPRRCNIAGPSSEVDRRRPGRLLNTKKAQSARNNTPCAQSNSQLMSLPPEIRNRIYNFVLGGNTIHVFRQSRWKLANHKVATIMVCCSDTDDRDAALTIRHGKKAQVVPLYSQRHVNCCLNDPRAAVGKSPFSLSILQTCSQVHREAALLPFQYNVFAFSYFGSFDPFIQLLMPAQRRAIANLCFGGNEIISHGSQIIKTLTGLNNVVIFNEISGYQSYSPERGLSEYEKFRMDFALPWFPAGSFKTCILCTYWQAPDSTGAAQGQTDPGTFDSASLEREQALAGKPD